jgi:hypothetical protein
MRLVEGTCVPPKDTLFDTVDTLQAYNSVMLKSLVVVKALHQAKLTENAIMGN